MEFEVAWGFRFVGVFGCLGFRVFRCCTLFKFLPKNNILWVLAVWCVRSCGVLGCFVFGGCYKGFVLLRVAEWFGDSGCFEGSRLFKVLGCFVFYGFVKDFVLLRVVGWFCGLF